MVFQRIINTILFLCCNQCTYVFIKMTDSAILCQKSMIYIDIFMIFWLPFHCRLPAEMGRWLSVAGSNEKTQQDTQYIAQSSGHLEKIHTVWSSKPTQFRPCVIPNFGQLASMTCHLCTPQNAYKLRLDWKSRFVYKKFWYKYC